MNDIRTTSLRPRVFLIKQHHTISNQMLERFISERKLIPAFDMFPENSLIESDIDKLMMSAEVSELPLEMFDRVEQAVNVLSDLMSIDWVVIPRTNNRVLFVAKVDQYQHIRYQAHLHIKHFIKFKESFKIPYNELTSSLLQNIGSLDNLAELPYELYSLIQKHRPDETPIVAADEIISSVVTISELEPEEEELILSISPKPVTDNQIVTHKSIASISRELDNINNHKKLHSSILELQNYLNDNMKNISEFHSPESDIAFRGEWHDDTQITVLAYSLNDQRGHNAWIINIVPSKAV